MKVLEVQFPGFFPMRVVLPDSYTNADCAVAGMRALAWSGYLSNADPVPSVTVLTAEGEAEVGAVFVYRYGEWRKE